MAQTISTSRNNNGETKGDLCPVSKLRRQYLDYLTVKQPEITEHRVARHYYHGDQWTADEVAELKRRRQPVVTNNRVGRKIDGVVGLVERLRQDPKAYPRTPQHADGADLATAVLRYVLDSNEWESKSPECCRAAAIEGIGGIEINIEAGDRGDPDVSFDIVDPDTFFYDPRSFRADFSDARFMGVAKWIDLEVAKEMFPEQADTLDGIMEDGYALGADQDRERAWVNTSDKRLRLIDHWYIWRGKWCWAVYVGDVILMEGVSPYLDEKNRTFCRYIMFSAAVDHDGDRYGFVRNMKSSQDEINHRRSKALHLLSSRRMRVEKGAFDDLEKARREAVRPDGVIEVNKGFLAEFEDGKSQADMVGQLQFLEEAKAEIENFGPNPALIGQGIENKSGRAIALLQQAGIAELGPFIIAYRGWKIRVYRALWNVVQRFWTGERWIRVTDDEGLAQFIQVNGVDIDPMTGLPTIVNALGSLDVDIILDEGPDTINMMADAYDGLMALGPGFMQAFPDIALELNPNIPSGVKKKMLAKLEQRQQPNPMEAQAAQLEMADKAAGIKKTEADTIKTLVDARKSEADAMKAAADTAMTFAAPFEQPLGPVEQDFLS